MTLAEYLDMWLRDYAQSGVAESTFRRYSIAIHKHIAPHVGSNPLTKLRPLHVQALHRTCGQEGLSPRTIAQHHRILHEALKHAVRWQLLAANPVASVAVPRFEKKEMRVLEKAGIDQLLAAASGTYLEALITLAIHTGARSGELLGLRWSDVDLDRGRLSIVRTAQREPGRGIIFKSAKTHRSNRPIALSAGAVEFLSDHRNRQQARLAELGIINVENLVFVQETGVPYEPSQISKAFRRLTTSTGMEGLRFHDLRHTSATQLLAANVHAKVVQERLGHASIDTTMDTYSHVLPGLQDAAASVMDSILPPRRRL